MNWNKVTVPDGAKLFQIHDFAFMYKGNTYKLEVDAFVDGTFTGHGEHSTDKSHVLASVSGKSVEECLNALINHIKA